MENCGSFTFGPPSGEYPRRVTQTGGKMLTVRLHYYLVTTGNNAVMGNG